MFAGDDLLKSRCFKLANGTRAAIVFMDSLSNKKDISDFVLRLLQLLPEKSNLQEICESTLAVCEATVEPDFEKWTSALVNGDALLLIDGNTQAAVLGTKYWQTRGVTEPPTSSVLRGPREGFNEDLMTNLSMIRRRFRTEKLKIKQLSVGKYTNTQIAVCYLDGIALPSLVKKVTQKIKEISIDGIIDSGYIAQLLDEHPYSAFQQCGVNEKPDMVAAKLLEGRIAIVVDGSPTVLTLPYLLLEDIQSSGDYYERRTHASFARIIRLIAIFIAVIAPSLYVSAQAYNLGMIPLRFTVSILNSVKGIPLSPALEMFLTVLIFEILNEASIRMPKYVGMALSIVGALVLGETAVSAGIVSPPTLMIMALSAISLFTVPELQHALSLLRVAFILLAGTVGVIGVILGVIFTLAYLSSLSANDTPLLAPFAPLVASDLKDTFLKKPITEMKKRPKSFLHANATRAKFTQKKD